MSLRVLCAIAFFVATLIVTESAFAAEEPSPGELRDVQFSLVTRGADESHQPLAECGGEAAIELAVEERVRRRVFVASELSDITLSIAFAGDGTRAIIVESTRVGVELGRRDVPLPPNDCTKSLETIAVVLAIMIGPERKTTEPPPGVPAELPPPEVPPPPPQKKEGPRPQKKRDAPAHWSVAPLAEIMVGTGVMPGVAWGIGGGVVVGTPVRRLFAIARAEYWPVQYTPTRPTAEVTRLGGALLGCAELIRAGATALSLCGGFDGGRLATESTAFSRTSNATVVLGVLAEARFGYRFERPLGPFLVEPVLAAQVSAILRRDRFTYRDEAGRELTLLKPAPLAIQGSIGVVLHFF